MREPLARGQQGSGDPERPAREDEHREERHVHARRIEALPVAAEQRRERCLRESRARR